MKDEEKTHQKTRDRRNAEHRQEDLASRDHRLQRDGGYKKDRSKSSPAKKS